MCGPDPVMARSVNVTTPFTALTVVVPDSVPVPLITVAVTGIVDDVTRLFPASRTRTTGWMANTFPETAPAGCVATLRFAAGPMATEKAVDGAAGTAAARANDAVKMAEERERIAAEKERIAEEKAARAEAAFQSSMKK